jgi:exosome complex protein LRP1
MESLSLPEDVKSQLERFEAAVASVETGLAPILALDRRELEAALTPLERAKVHVSMANAVSTLFSMYLKAVGLDPADHAVKRELERVALYRTKLDKAAAAERRAAGKTARSTVDAAAAGRMVKHALGTTRDEPSDASEGERDEEKPKERKRKSETGGKSGGKKKKR